jgi:DNA modification methylase
VTNLECNVMRNPVNVSHPSSGTQHALLREIDRLTTQLALRFERKFVVHPSLSRRLVSFQANKTRPVYRWYPFKEAFSAALVEYLLHQYQITSGQMLDPFAGSGTTLFVARAMGIDADGIEVLPVGQAIIRARHVLEAELTSDDFERLRYWADRRVWKQSETRIPVPELRITRGAYPEPTKESIERYLGACQHEHPSVQSILRFALLCIVESISFTRKDGQYLRWDYRSGRTRGKNRFEKGEILDFDQAIGAKINEILGDVSPVHQTHLFPGATPQGTIRVYDGSCLHILPELPDGLYDAIMTSPPYCNRYDYTRTYALELALLGIDEQGLARLRQEMLSCTVEHRTKDLLRMNPRWATALAAADKQDLLQSILIYLEDQKAHKALNNDGIPRMIRGYFYELACVIAECVRVLKPGARLLMVNDNVRYAGVSIPVDLILSDIAEQLGFSVEHILVLPHGKGNSSQQMGKHGRESLRKCVYVWRT